MGSGGSRRHCAGTVRAPLFLYWLDQEIKKRSRPLVRGCGPRRLLHDADCKEISSKDDDVSWRNLEGKDQQNDDKKLDVDSDDDEEEEEGNHGRKIGRDDHLGFPGSPSFRVFVKTHGNKNAKHGKMKSIDALEGSIPSNDTEQSQEHSCNKKKEEKRRRSRRTKSLSMVLPKGGQAAVKNLLNVKTCYISPSHRRRNLITEKETVV